MRSGTRGRGISGREKKEPTEEKALVNWHCYGEGNLMSPEFVAFLLEAKRRTYAAQGDDATVEPALPGSKQLEYCSGEYLYRDVYFGIRCFVGQETVYRAGRPVWSMAYGGGIARSGLTMQEVRSVYAFLREAMRLVQLDQPFRGPANHRTPPYTYSCSATGDLGLFWGTEAISDEEGVAYRLHFSGARVDQ